MGPLKLIDIPPVWLAIAIGVLAAETRMTGGLTLPGWTGLVGWGLIGAGLLLMFLALAAFSRGRTSPIPHTAPQAILTEGVFSISRNPIYLGDALVLLGIGVLWGAASVVLVAPLFVFLIERRFIRAEEDRLQAAFPEEWSAYRAAVPRWVGRP
ncbi:MAG: isoprenylcysteine carboxylmethyltransferase family protein [Pseudomonadota bacterium]